MLVLSNFASKKFKPGYDYKNSDGLKIVAIGNLKSVKNFQLAVDAMGELNNFPITLDIYGNGPLETELLAQITANGASVNLRGKQEITPSLLNPYDVFLMTSKHEGMPISLLEAICFGMPCLLPDHLPIMKSVAGNAAHYFSIQQKDSLVKAILCLYENKPVLIGMNTTALERANDYTADHHIHSLLKVYTN